MTTYFVDGNAGSDSNDGSSARPWKTITKATEMVREGDEVRIRTGIYREKLRLEKARTTWKADTGHKPALDGRYHPGLFNPNGTLPHPEVGGGFLPEGRYGSMIGISGDGVVVDGLTLQNLAGTGITTGGNGTVIRNCRIDFVYDTAIKVNPPNYVDNVLIENNVITRASVRYYDPNRVGGEFSESVGGMIKMGRTRDSVVRNNICAYGLGEGFNIGKASYRTLVEGNIIHTCNHVHVYINRSIDITVRNNLIYHLYFDDFVGNKNDDGRPPAAIAIGDEHAGGNDNWPHSAGGQIYNNIVIGLGSLFTVRNNVKNYNTQLDNCYIGYNTFIGRSRTVSGIQIAGNVKGRPHRNSIFENNIIYNCPRISAPTGDLGGIVFRNNLWGEQPEPSMRGQGDRIGDPGLRNPVAELRADYPNPISNIDPRNYGLTERSTLAIDRASDGSGVNGLQLPAVRKDFFGSTRSGQGDIGAHEFDGTPEPIIANFSIGAGQSVGQVPHSVDFIDKSTSDRPIVRWAWDFGDGGTSNEANTSHTYEAAGTYSVTLSVTNDKGATDSLTREDLISVIQEPIAFVPDEFRRFALMSDPETVLAFGVQYPDFRCIVVWHSEPFHMLNFADVEEVERGMNRFLLNNIELRWIDPAQQSQPLSDDEPISIEETVFG